MNENGLNWTRAQICAALNRLGIEWDNSETDLELFNALPDEVASQ
jgi:hypothetical protein